MNNVEQLQVLMERYMRAQLWSWTGFSALIPSGQQLYDAFFCITPTLSFDQWCLRAGEDIQAIRNEILEKDNDEAIDVLQNIGGLVKVEISGETK